MKVKVPFWCLFLLHISVGVLSQPDSLVSMSLHRRLNAGVDDSVLVRYPADLLDRIWEPFNSPSSWTQVNTTSPVKTPPNDMFQAPSMVMQSGSSNDPGYQIRFYWVIELEYKSPTYFVVMYFAELVPPPSPNPGPDPKKPPKKGSGNSTNQFREFSISINGYLWYDLPVVPQYLMTSEVYGYTQPTTYTQYNVLLQPTDNATLAPLLNAVEIFVVLPTADLPTDSGDCRNLSSTGLSGGIATYFSNFTELQSLDLSFNQLSGSVPSALQKKSQDGTLTLRANDNGSHGPSPSHSNNSSSLSGSASENKMNKSGVIAGVTVTVVVISLVVLFIVLRKRRRPHGPAAEAKPMDWQNRLRIGLESAQGHSSNPSSTTSSMYMRNDNAFTYPSGVGEVSQTYEMGHIVSGPAAR
ncbi:putative leucine-rich repeat receptor-like protein kinase [Carex littledalei]|uniref:Putative leucine-rich repeat receptor-like protein kinase n=1 Tax=Carex littledalei TaxID=544730 RepID=A0A833QKT7_9POAL|nr:putative leucine-rich repeat receptor-like protein kinase [Carex littledalei]